MTKLKEYEVSVRFKVALYSEHDTSRVTIYIQETMSKAVHQMSKDAFPPMLSSQTSTTVTGKTNDQT